MKTTSLIIAIAMVYVFSTALYGSGAAGQRLTTGGRTMNLSDSVVGLICTWSAYSTYDESIVIDLKDRAAYWVNQNRPLNISELNAGRVVLSGVRASVRVSKKRIAREIAVRMIIDRISGAFYVQQKVFRQTGPGRCKRSRLF